MSNIYFDRQASGLRGTAHSYTDISGNLQRFPMCSGALCSDLLVGSPAQSLLKEMDLYLLGCPSRPTPHSALDSSLQADHRDQSNRLLSTSWFQ